MLDSPGIDLSTSGAGTPGDPRIISADTKAVYYQTTGLTFSHTIAGAADVYEKITEQPDLVLATAGLYIVTMDVVGTLTIAEYPRPLRSPAPWRRTWAATASWCPAPKRR